MKKMIAVMQLYKELLFSLKGINLVKFYAKDRPLNQKYIDKMASSEKYFDYLPIFNEVKNQYQLILQKTQMTFVTI